MSSVATKPKRHLFRFSLRALLLLVAVIGVSVGWKMNRVRNHRRIVAEIERLGGQVFRQRPNDGTVELSGASQPSPDGGQRNNLEDLLPADFPEPAKETFRQRVERALFDDDVWSEVVLVKLSNPKASNALLDDICQLPSLTSLTIASNAITDSGVTALRRVKLKQLSLCSNALTNACLPTLHGMTELTELRLGGNGFTDEGLNFIERLPHLQTLGLKGSGFTDKSLRIVAKVKGIELVWLNGTRVTQAGLDGFENERPDCMVCGEYDDSVDDETEDLEYPCPVH